MSSAKFSVILLALLDILAFSIAIFFLDGNLTWVIFQLAGTFELLLKNILYSFLEAIWQRPNPTYSGPSIPSCPERFKITYGLSKIPCKFINYESPFEKSTFSYPYFSHFIIRGHSS